jgi:hypothetical protein
VWAGVDSVWEQENAEARKMLENAAESHTSGARFVRLLYPSLLYQKNESFDFCHSPLKSKEPDLHSISNS